MTLLNVEQQAAVVETVKTNSYDNFFTSPSSTESGNSGCSWNEHITHTNNACLQQGMCSQQQQQQQQQQARKQNSYGTNDDLVLQHQMQVLEQQAELLNPSQVENIQNKQRVNSTVKDIQKKARRTRTIYSAKQLIELERNFQNNPYVSRPLRTVLADNLELSEQQIKIWFQNRRTKYNKEQAGKNSTAKSKQNTEGVITPEVGSQYSPITQADQQMLQLPKGQKKQTFIMHLLPVNTRIYPQNVTVTKKHLIPGINYTQGNHLPKQHCYQQIRNSYGQSSAYYQNNQTQNLYFASQQRNISNTQEVAWQQARCEHSQSLQSETQHCRYPSTNSTPQNQFADYVADKTIAYQLQEQQQSQCASENSTPDHRPVEYVEYASSNSTSEHQLVEYAAVKTIADQLQQPQYQSASENVTVEYADRSILQQQKQRPVQYQTNVNSQDVYQIPAEIMEWVLSEST